MQIHLQKLNQQMDQQLHLHETIQIDSLQNEVSGLIDMKDVDVEAHIFKLDPHLIQVEAKQSIVAKFTCSRCLKTFEHFINMEWTEQFTDEADRAQENEEQEIHLIQGNVLDLTPYIREAVILHIPYAPVCREDCKGLCPKCGIDQNEDSCQCETRSIDPRLAKLQDLLINRDK
ncbi:YceD family protein [Hazenella coriacea]|uniref:DUF177 domain-containing protein n=1 Tax=Hazenella coriacea TaxID=1179467 RepID=A0A4R3L4Q5_9BACL|nr:DUF177 domain-containing protein [Hazenella coriacea]TCS93104.1 uncharacterized protein EDD58_10946 [Hazenella coriacea]